MSRRVEILAEATAEAIESRIWYEDRDPSLGADFMHELDLAIARIADHPDRWPMCRREARQYYIRRFPFRVVYVFDETVVRIIAVAHQRRRPGYREERI